MYMLHVPPKSYFIFFSETTPTFSKNILTFILEY